MYEGDEMDETNRRLVNIERKVDDLTGMTVALARVEERMVNYFTASQRLGVAVDNLDKELDNLRERVAELERSHSVSVVKVNFGERIFWIAVTAILTLAITALMTI